MTLFLGSVNSAMRGPLARAGAERKGRPVIRTTSHPLSQQGADHLLDEQGARIDLIEVAIAVIITVGWVEIVPAPEIVGDLAEGIAVAIGAPPALAPIELLRLAGRHAAVVLFGEPGRAAADAIAIRIFMGIPMAMAVARMSDGRCADTERRGAGEKH